MSSKRGVFFGLLVSLTIIFGSCKKLDQSIKRDVIITSAETEFTIPVINNLNTGQVAGVFPASLDLDAEVRRLTDGEFGKANVKDIKIRSLRISLVDTPTVANNNLGNFEFYNVTMISGSNKVVLTDTQNNPSGLISTVDVQNFSTATSLKPVLDAGSFTYDIRVKARTVTTAPLKAVITATYTASLSF